MYKDGDTCPLCAKGTLRKSSFTESMEYQGQMLERKTCEILVCDSCGSSATMSNATKERFELMSELQEILKKGGVSMI